MWCTKCGVPVEDNFCGKCGQQKMALEPVVTVNCNGQTEDGSLCNAVLNPMINVCKACEKTVDQSLFSKKNCRKCRRILAPNSNFCSFCGEKNNDAVTPGDTSQAVNQDQSNQDQSNQNDGSISDEIIGNTNKELSNDLKKHDNDPDVAKSSTDRLHASRETDVDRIGEVASSTEVKEFNQQMTSIEESSERLKTCHDTLCDLAEAGLRNSTSRATNPHMSTSTNESINRAEHEKDDIKEVMKFQQFQNTLISKLPETNNCETSTTIHNEEARCLTTDLPQQKCNEGTVDKKADNSKQTSLIENATLTASKLSDNGSNTSQNNLKRQTSRESNRNAQSSANITTGSGTDKATSKVADNIAVAPGHENSSQERKMAGRNNGRHVKNLNPRTGNDNKQFLRVKFHALLSPEFKFNPSCDKVVLRMEDAAGCGGWKNNDLLLDFIREHPKGIMEFEIEKDFTKSFIESPKWLEYKYYIIRKGKTSTGKGRKDLWDHYYVDGYTGEKWNRQLFLPQEWTTADFWHQFDGVINRKPKKQNVIGKIMDYAKDIIVGKPNLLNDADTSIRLFSTTCIETFSGANTSLQIIEAVQMLQMLVHGINRVYIMDAKLVLDKDVETACAELVLYSLLKALEGLPPTGKVEQRKRMTTQWSVVALIQLLNIQNLEFIASRDWREFCKGLLIHPDFQTKHIRELDFIDQHFPNQRQTLKDGLVKVVKTVMRVSKDPAWLYVMPLIHYLSEECTPFDSATCIQHNIDDSKWWGVHSIGEYLTKSFKLLENAKWEIPLSEIIYNLEPLFDVDFLLPRTIIASLNLTELQEAISMQKIPNEVCCAGIIQCLRKMKPLLERGRLPKMEEQVLPKCTMLVLNGLQNQVTESDVQKLDSQLAMAEQLAKETLKYRLPDLCSCSVQIYLNCLALKYTALKSINEEHISWERSVVDLLQLVIVYLKHNFVDFSNYMGPFIKIWSDMFAGDELMSEEIGVLWNKTVDVQLKYCLQCAIQKDTNLLQRLVKIYCENISTYKSIVQECLQEVVIEAIENSCSFECLSVEDGEQRKRVGGLVYKMFEAAWAKMVEKSGTSDTDALLQQLLTWSPFLQFLKMFSNNQDKWIFPNESSREKLNKTISLIESMTKSLFNGDITIGNLILLRDHADLYAKFAAEIHKQKDNIGAIQSLVLKAIKIREKEYKAFKKDANDISKLISLCGYLKQINAILVDFLETTYDIGKKKLSELCQPVDINATDFEQYQPDVIAFQIPQQLKLALPDICKLNESNVFSDQWRNKCKELCDQCTKLEDIAHVIWEPVKQRCSELSKRIERGEISFQEMEDVVRRECKDDFKTVAKDLMILNLDKDIINQRVEQLQKYRLLQACKRGAKAIVKFQETYELNPENFETLSCLNLDEDQDMEMRLFKDSVLDNCTFLKDLTEERSKCLESFCDCKQLVQWLKESMATSGIKELRVFVDLAFMTAGDDPYNINKVQCLHLAVTGYAPLIFDLDGKTAGHKELLDLCRLVWKEIDLHPSLPDKLIDSNRELQWFQEIERLHGSVEVTSLMQAAAINEDGVYYVGKNATNNQERNTKEKDDQDFVVNVNDSMILTVTPRTKKETRIYSFTQLQDLQSRLMLVAGKDEKANVSVDTFTMVFDSITRLTKVYVRLCSSGCVFFNGWSAQFLCDDKKPVAVIIEFGGVSDAEELKGKKARNEGLTEIIPVLCEFMETCLKEWQQHIKEKRNSFVHLNYFTIDQLVILQQEIVKFGTEHDPTHLIYPLLSVVKKGCTPDDLQQAISDAMAALKKSETSNNSEDTDIQDNNENDRKSMFMAGMCEAGFEKFASAAYEKFGPDEIVDAINWYAEHEDDLDVSPSNSGFSRFETSNVSMESLINSSIIDYKKNSDGERSKLIETLRHMWKQFLHSVSSSMNDFLSLDHLGLILEHLAKRDICPMARSLPQGLEQGQPNLIVCSTADVLTTTLTVYLRDKDRNQPLPSSDEVLFCNQNTTMEEIDIFWRRALFDCGGKIHCLVHADLLAFNVSEYATDDLKEYMSEAKLNERQYRLIVICCSDNENRSTIVSFLDKYRRNFLSMNKEDITANIRMMLMFKEDKQMQVVPAALVDKDKSTVRVIKSCSAGVGKTLYKERKAAELDQLGIREQIDTQSISIPLQEKQVDLHYVIKRLLGFTAKPGHFPARIFHVDIAPEVQSGVDYLLFNLLVLGCVVDKTGYVWRKGLTDLYLIETTVHSTDRSHTDLNLLNVLPDLTCRSPQESLNIYLGKATNYQEGDQLFDEQEFSSDVFQRPFQNLLRLDKGQKLDDIQPKTKEGTPQSCLETLIRHCGIVNPSWAEIHNFVWFLNTQLLDFEQNSFVSAAADEMLPGFAKFVLRFLIQMSRDFSTRSLVISEESPEEQGELGNDENNEHSTNEHVDELQGYQLRRTWASSPHPYLFFNSDRETFTFLGFYIDRFTYDLIDQDTGTILEKRIMTHHLYRSLLENQAPLNENFETLPRHLKIQKLCSVMGLEFAHDPDDTYELTTDNVKKILAIYMRFRCDIPVIVMGETGCGKTRLVKFMCALQSPPGDYVNNMILMKVHGGITHKDIITKVKEAEAVAKENTERHGKNMYTVLFFDEANTTESIGIIKEILCDKRVLGQPIQLCENLKFVAACNPYRKHDEGLIKKLEQAGLGYHVDADKTSDKLGRVPMRRLVYRVQPLPQSLLPLVWDFGQLSTAVEKLYIKQMIKRFIDEHLLPDIPGLIDVVSDVITKSQDFMRQQKDECSFVSLRDVDRVLRVMSWFIQQCNGFRTLYTLMDAKPYPDLETVSVQAVEGIDSEQDDFSENSQQLSDYDHVTSEQSNEKILSDYKNLCGMTEKRELFLEYLNSDDEDIVCSSVHEGIDDDSDISTELLDDDKSGQSGDITRSLILSLGVCYHACLKNREEYRKTVAPLFRKPCSLLGGADRILYEINCCQEVFIENMYLEKNIAKNTALKENVFMMVTCIELRIPLFLVGKPGSSKSLAKTIVSDAMQGQASKTALFKEFKQVQLVSFQCSPLSTPDGILGTFKQCAQFQKDKNLDTFVSIVVLDEVGLAEDSPKMPLKTLHPLLEDGCQGDEKPEPHMKVAFIGISNWALDPAKMNRGLLVQREVPDLEELIITAKGICATNNNEISTYIEPLIPPLADSYLEVFKQVSISTHREFFGLRDFYSLVKMVCHYADTSQREPTWSELLRSIKRNFGGLDQLEPEQTFKDKLGKKHEIAYCSTSELIQDCFTDSNDMNRESRYLLLVTENFGALNIIQQEILAKANTRPMTIFGSSFRSDQEYTQICRNINKIKICMETGKTVVLLNLENLYESLYDALNQYYVKFGGERYVDLGLGTHRVKCPVHKKFRLIVIAEKQTVYEKFPIPLINRLEKHLLRINTMLNPEQLDIAKKLEEWVKTCASQMDKHNTSSPQKKDPSTSPGDIFIGYHSDTCSAIILHISKQVTVESGIDVNQVLLEAQKCLLWCATPEAVLRSIMRETSLKDVYFKEQAHNSLEDYLHFMIIEKRSIQIFAQVTTHSKLLSSQNKLDICNAVGIPLENVMLLESISSFDTEQQFSNKISKYLQNHFTSSANNGLIILQCDSGDVNANLIACTRYCVMDEFEKLHEKIKTPVYVVLIVQLPRTTGGCFTGFQCGTWHSVHIDDLYKEDTRVPNLEAMLSNSVGELFDAAVTQEVTDEMENSSNITDNETRQRETTLSSSTGKIHVEGLIFSSVQTAISMVKDNGEDIKRETERVSIVLRLLKEKGLTDSCSFLSGIRKLIAKLLKEKEEQTQGKHKATNWLAEEASKRDTINQAGTLRRACLQKIESKIVPVLARIVAFLDTNNNLDLLDIKQMDWKRRLWLTIFNASEALPLKFTAPESPTSMKQHQDIVTGTGFEGHAFTATMPFSWIIHKWIVQIIQSKFDDANGESQTQNSIDDLIEVFHNSPLGRILYDTDVETEVIEGTKKYISDFVHTVYNAGSEDEYHLVCEDICRQTDTLYKELKTSNLLSSILSVHLVHRKLTQQLAYFHAANQVWPNCSSKLKTNDMFEKMDMVQLTWCLLVDDLTPTNAIDDPNSRADWLNRVHRYRPLIEKFLCRNCTNDPTSCLYRPHMMWRCVLVVKLFIEHVCTNNEKDKLTVQRCKQLWVSVKAKNDVTSFESLEAIEKFLKTCNSVAIKEYEKSKPKCIKCEEALEDLHIILPCRDPLCDGCFKNITALNDYKCPNCKKSFEKKWSPKKESGDRSFHEKIKDFQKRCNAFFLDVVSQIFFAEYCEPSPKVVEKLFGFIKGTSTTIIHTKELTIFDSGLDPNPVFRSFLLQLLMRTSEQNVKENLEKYLQEVKGFMLGDDNDRWKQYIELYLMVIQCLEDVFYRVAIQSDEGEVAYTTEALKESLDYINGDHFSVNTLYGLAYARMGLTVAAKYIAECVTSQEDDTSIPMSLIKAAQKLCEKSNLEWPRIYLVKWLCRFYGFEVYQDVCRYNGDFLKWIMLPDIDTQQVRVPDRYVVCGDDYKKIREALTNTIVHKDGKYLTETLTHITSEIEISLFLAFHREVSLSGVHNTMERTINEEVLTILKNIIETCTLVTNKDSLNSLICNQLVPNRLNTVEIEGQLGIVCLVVHFMSVVLHIKEDKSLLQPLVSISMNPTEYVTAFLPTMPQDELEEIKKIVLTDGSNMRDNPAFYNCPNGHPYLIIDCGNPNSIGKCNVCGAAIGGMGHEALPGNVRDTSTDTTMTGHILGQAKNGSPILSSERNMSPVYCACLRLLLHLAMYIGSGQQRKAIQQMIKPSVNAEDLDEFLWSHIVQDINNLHRSLGRSVDDVMLLMHTLLHSIMTCHVKEYNLTEVEVYKLSTKKGRNNWETMFCHTFLQPILQDIENVLKIGNESIVQDERLGANPILSMVYEMEKYPEMENTSRLQDIPRVWRYRTPISISHLRHEFEMQTFCKNNGTQKYGVLHQFLKQDHHLRALRYIPSVLRLHRMLLNKYQKQLDKTEASSITVAQIIREEAAGPDTKMMIQDFRSAWDLVRDSLKLYACMTDKGPATVSEDYCNSSIKDEAPLTVLLPTTKEAGLCSYALLHFLMQQQNEFLETCLRDSQRDAENFPIVSPRDITAYHLISYDPQQDILPLMLANCQYSFEIGKGTNIEYDFESLERQLIDRFLFSKSIIEIGQMLQIDMMIFRTEMTNAEVFRKLTEKIPQETLTDAIKSKIVEEFHSYPDMCQSLNNLNTAINFILTTGADQKMCLHDYMSNVLKMSNSLHSQKARQECQTRHIKSLWLLISCLKSKRMCQNGQSRATIFESVDSAFHEDIPEDVKDEFRTYMKGLSSEKLSQLVDILHEFILLKIALRENVNDEDFLVTTDNILKHYLSAYIEEMDNPPIDITVLKDFPKSIVYKHSVDFWITAQKILVHKQRGHTVRRH